MQFIRKQAQPPQEFIDAISNWNEDENQFQSADRYEEDQNGTELKYKGFVRAFLRNEQFGLCAICQRSIGSNYKTMEAIIGDEYIKIEPTDIEHVVAQKVNPDDSLNYNNLVASCRTPHTCNAARGSQDIEPYFFNPKSITSLTSINPFFEVDLGTFEINAKKDGLTDKESEDVKSKFIEPYKINQLDLVTQRKALFSIKDEPNALLKRYKGEPKELRKKIQQLASDQTIPFREFQLIFLHSFARLHNISV